MKYKKIAIILVIAILLVAYYWLGTGYIKERRQNSTLSTDIDDTMLLLAEIPPIDPDLQERLDEVQNELELALNYFPLEPNTTVIINSILRTAEDIGIKAIPLFTKSWTVETLDDYNVNVFRLNLAVSGTSQQFSDFLYQLENGETPTMVIEYLTVNREEEASFQESISESSIMILADLDITIYAQAPEAE